MKKYRVYILIAIALIVIIVISYMPFKNSTEKRTVKNKITIKVSTDRTDLIKSKLKDMADEYMKENPNVKIDIVGKNNLNVELKEEASTQHSDDITIVPSDVSKKALSTFYEPLDDMNFNSSNLSGYKYGLGDDGKLYSVNSGVGYTGIVYNKQCFKKAGIKRAPVTMDEFYNDCQKIKDISITPFALNLGDKWPMDVYGDSFVLPSEISGDTKYLSKITDGKLFDNKSAITKIMQFFSTMKKRGYFEDDLLEQKWNKFKIRHATGTVAMSLLGTWYPNQLADMGVDKDDIGMFPFPDTKILIQQYEWFFAIPKSCKNKEETKKLFKWLFYDGHYAKACSIIPAVRNADSESYWFLHELLSYQKPVRNIDAISSRPIKYPSAVLGKNLTDVFKEYIESDDPESVIKKYNKIWNENRRN